MSAWPRVRPFIVPIAGVVVVACFISSTTRARPLSLADPVTVRSPVKVHLIDGSVVMYRNGLTVGGDSIRGDGVRYSVTLRNVVPAAALPLDSVVGAVTFERRVNAGRTLAYSLLPWAVKGAFTMAAVHGDISILKAMFGSCPTIYSDSAGIARLESESFSYSIAPLLEKRDVDFLHAAPDTKGVLRLEVRNEALETHYINHLEVLEIAHRPDEQVYPTPYGGPAAVSRLAAPISARDRAGRDLRDVLDRVDDRAFVTDDATLARAAAIGSTDQRDWIDLAMHGESRDSVALVLRMRSSLLTTVLFYDYMLARPGARSLDWVGEDLQRITTLAKLARWYTGRLGLQVEVLDHGKYRQVARLVDFGPIAWRNVAVLVPTLGQDTVRVRLSFVADEWRIDRVAVASSVRRPAARAISITAVTDPSGSRRPEVMQVIARADEERLETVPGERFFAHFDVGPRPAASRTFLVAAQGYYTEWVRGSWMKAPTDTVAFDPSRVRMDELLRTWRERRPTLEAEFFKLRVPVT